MKTNIKNILLTGFALASLMLLNPVVLAQEYDADLALEAGSLGSKEAVLADQTVRIYAKVKNNSSRDLLGRVKFYDETRGEFIAEDQPVSVVAGGTDDVFVDWKAGSSGTKKITARILPWEDEGDDPSNNKISASIYVDVDSDGDGIPNQKDPDDDNDAVPDDEDAFPLDPRESEDTDGDGIGNNADEDDDGDGVPDIEDVFPTDAGEISDKDGDRHGDQSDAFPEDPTEWADEDGDGIGSNSDVDDHNQGPEPKIEIKTTPIKVGENAIFDGSNSTDVDGQVVDYIWEVDGEEIEGPLLEKTFEKAGIYKVSLTVTDEKGESRAVSETVRVESLWQNGLKIGSVALILVILVIIFRHAWKKRKNTLSKKEK